MTNRLTSPAHRAARFVLNTREEIQYRLIKAGAPALLVGIALDELPDMFGRAQYVLKTHWTEFVREGSLASLIREAEHEARAHWAD